MKSATKWIAFSVGGSIALAVAAAHAADWYPFKVEVWDPPFNMASPRKVVDYVSALIFVYFVLIIANVVLSWVQQFRPIPYNMPLRAVLGFIEEFPGTTVGSGFGCIANRWNTNLFNPCVHM